MIDQLGELFQETKPAAIIVQGDTTTVCAGAQAANYLGIPVIHVEAGLRSFDRGMPEEINRCVTGVLADVHCAPTTRAVANLIAEGVPAEKITLTGNTIVEATNAMLPSEKEAAQIAAEYGAEPDGYVLSTIHRPENTDDPARLEMILTELGKLGLMPELDRLQPIPPVDHRTFLGLSRLARLIVSDSGGVQEECTVLKRPLIVVRNSTERPESIDAGFAHLVQPGRVIGELGRQLISDQSRASRLAQIPCPYGDGLASDRIAACIQPFIAACR